MCFIPYYFGIGWRCNQKISITQREERLRERNRKMSQIKMHQDLPQGELSQKNKDKENLFYKCGTMMLLRKVPNYSFTFS